MAQERLAIQENESIWKSRFFKFGLAVAVIFAAIGAMRAAAAGVLIAGAAWAAWRGK